jgi:hypothetical protein
MNIKIVEAKNMKKLGLNIPTIIAFFLVPVIAAVRVIYEGPSLAYGHGDITEESVLILIFAIYCFFVSAFNFIRAHKGWKHNDEQWKKLTTSAHICNIAFAISLAILTLFGQLSVNYGGSFYSSSQSFFELLQGFLYMFMFVSLAWLFPLGIVLLVLGLGGLKYSKSRPKGYLVVTIITAVLFTLGGALPAFIVSMFWIGGGIVICYCPVNKRSLKIDLLQPLYNYRKRKLEQRLNI